VSPEMAPIEGGGRGFFIRGLDIFGWVFVDHVPIMFPIVFSDVSNVFIKFPCGSPIYSQ